MTIKTNLFCGELLRLASPRHEDAAIMFAWGEDAEYLRNVDTDIAYPKSMEEGKTPEPGYFHLRTIEDDRFIGFVVIHSIEWNNRAGNLSIGIGDSRDRNKGYGQEALKLILRYAFQELNLDRVGLDVIEYNKGGIRAYEKVGFQHEGRKRSFVYRDGKRYDLLFMGILRTEWEEIHLRK